MKSLGFLAFSVLQILGIGHLVYAKNFFNDLLELPETHNLVWRTELTERHQYVLRAELDEYVECPERNEYIKYTEREDNTRMATLEPRFEGLK